MRAVGWGCLAAAIVLATAACGLTDGLTERTAGPTASATTTPGPAANTTPPATTPPPPLAVPEAGLGPGDTGELVAELERRLDALRYDVGAVDDAFDTDTVQGVTAFQKVHDLPRSGRATPDVADRLASAQLPAAIVPAGGPSRVEVDLPRQVLFLYEGGNLHKVLSISTGSGEDYYSYTVEDWATAVTPPGTYQVHYHVDGWDSAPLGELYNPAYFDPERGLAIHGSEDVPADPASHGCIRISMTVAEWFPDKAPTGTPVYVSDGQSPLQPV